MCAYPPWPPFVRGAGSRWRAVFEGREQRAARLPPVAPLRKGGGLTLAVGRFLRGENVVCAYPPWHPLVRGAGSALAGGF